MRKLLLAVAAVGALLVSQVNVASNMDDRTYVVTPTNDLSAIRYIVCDNPDNPAYNYVGSGFLIGDHILATALHVASEPNCRDAETGSQLYTYAKDEKHDLALLTSPELPTDIPYYKISCERFVTGRKYLSYGISPYGQKRPILRDNALTATKDYTSVLDLIGDTPSPGLRLMDGPIAPGMSGGPVVDPETGEVLAVNNAGNADITMLYELADGILCNK